MVNVYSTVLWQIISVFNMLQDLSVSLSSVGPKQPCKFHVESGKIINFHIWLIFTALVIRVKSYTSHKVIENVASVLRGGEEEGG